MANNDPAFEVPTATGTLQGAAQFQWNGTAWTAAASGVSGGTTGAAVGFTPRVTGTVARPADNTAYSIGDIIANSVTANLVVPITFTVARIAGGSGRVTGARCAVVAASGTIVLPAFDLLLFRPEASIPFAAAGYPADNTALTVSGAAMAELVGVLSFTSTAWRNSAGGTTAAGAAIYQATSFLTRPYAPFNLTTTAGTDILGLLQAQNTWTPTGVVNTFTFHLDVDQD